MQKQRLNYIVGSIIVIVIWAVGFWTVSKVEENQRLELKRQFLETQRMYLTTQKLRYDRLVESAYLLAENSTFKANLELEDPPSIEYSIKQFSRYMKVDMFVVVGKNGNILTEIGNTAINEYNIASLTTIQEALNGKEPDINITWPTLKMINSQLYHIVGVPIYAGRNSIIGALMLGLKFTQPEVDEIKKERPFEVSLIHKDKLIASSVKSTNLQKLSIAFFNKYFGYKTIDMDRSNSFMMIEEPIYKESMIAFISPMGKADRAFFMCLLPEADAMNLTNNLARWIYLLNGLLTIGIGFICFTKINSDSLEKKRTPNDI